MNQLEISIWSQTQAKLKNFVVRYTKDRAVAEDIVQDVFLKVHAKLNQLKDSEKVTSWIYQIARNSIIDHFRKQSRVLETRDIDWESEVPSLNDCAEHCVKELLQTLPEKYREALQLSEIENYSQIELSRKLNISYSGAKSRVQRARRLLRERVDEKYLIETDRYGNVIVCKDKGPCDCPSTHSEVCE